jgi:hypothetical protein
VTRSHDELGDSDSTGLYQPAALSTTSSCASESAAERTHQAKIAHKRLN